MYGFHALTLNEFLRDTAIIHQPVNGLQQLHYQLKLTVQHTKPLRENHFPDRKRIFVLKHH